MKQTAVEWLEEFLKDRYILMNSEAIFQHAKEMEKEQIQDAYNYGQQIPPFEYAEKYYNETYGQK
jgi:HEPN domain-containing protein